MGIGRQSASDVIVGLTRMPDQCPLLVEFGKCRRGSFRLRLRLRLRHETCAPSIFVEAPFSQLNTPRTQSSHLVSRRFGDSRRTRAATNIS